MRALIFAAALAAAACGGKSSGGSTPQATGGDCPTAGNNIATLVPDLDDAQMTAVANAIADNCAANSWSAEAVACFSNAESADAMQPCGDTLTPEQQQALAADMEARAAEEDSSVDDEPEEPALDDSELEE